jgi:NADH dehydrogenase [ubiquinone] 1 alpha subcomplex assembly factor 1
MVEDVSGHRYLALRLRLGGDARARNSYFVNLQTDGPITSDLWQHRLYFRREDGGWEDIFVSLCSPLTRTLFLVLTLTLGQIPFQNFVLTNSGEVASHQISMYREKVRSVGISLLGGNSGFAGPYELGIDTVRAVNEEDVTTPAVHS